jgi:tetratricopeptide (TPR) repeat protein
MKHTFLLFLILLGIAQMGEGQVNPLVAKAAELCDEKKYDEALAQIDEGFKSADLNTDANAWFVKGFILKELYKQKEANQRQSNYRFRSVAALKKAREFDANLEFASNIDAALQYIAFTYFNDAVLRSAEMNSESENEPLDLFKKFEELYKGSESELKDLKVEFNSKMAEGHYRNWIINTEDNHHYAMCLEYYSKVLAFDSRNCTANLNLAIVNYNQGVYMIRKIGAQTDMMDLIAIQDESVKKFKSAIPFAQQAFASCTPSSTNYKVLMFVNRALGREEEYLRLKKESEKKFKSN